jgi:hypothetical protein
MLLVRLEPDDISRTNLFFGSTFSLDPTKTGNYDQRLTERVRVPGRTRAWLKSDASSGHSRRLRGLEQGINPHIASEPIFRSFTGWPRSISCDFHVQLSSKIVRSRVIHH